MNDMPATTNSAGRKWWLIGVIAVTALITFAVTALLINIFQRKDEAKATSYTQVVAIDDKTYDPAVWGKNYPTQYDAYKETAVFTPTDHNKALVPHTPTADDPRKETTASKLEEDPRLVTLWKGYAFSIDYRHLRGHEWMLEDQRTTKRVTAVKKPQPGACLNCHASTPKVYDELGNGDMNAGFDAMNKMLYTDATKLAEHPVACIDCHDPSTMKLRVTRPALINGLKLLKASEGIENYDVNKDASNEDMRTYVCAQCHVEYYMKGDEKTLTYPWKYGTDLDSEYKFYNEIEFTDFEHAITGAKMLKAQHPEFEVWSEGVHAANGVTCADCHMSYKSVGAEKVSNHDITSPMGDINGTCGTCHNVSDDSLKNRVTTIQNRFVESRDRALDAVVALVNDIEAAMKDGKTSDETLNAAREYQRFASFYVDFAYSENSYGFHAPDYMQRLLSQSLDAARKGQLVLKGVSADQLAPSDVLEKNKKDAEKDGLF